MNYEDINQYVTQTGTTFQYPAEPNENLGEVLQIIFDKYPEVKEEMKSLFIKEGVSAYGESGLQGVGLFKRMGDYFRDIDDDLLNNAVNNAIEGLSSLEYISAYPYKEPRSLAYGEYLVGQDPFSDEANLNIRNFPGIPDTVFYPSPSQLEYSVYNPDLEQYERKTDIIDNDMALHTLVHEGLLHGMNIWHPTSPFSVGSSRNNYIEATDNIINMLSDADKQKIINAMVPEGREEMLDLYFR
jgi:hypothetical protein